MRQLISQILLITFVVNAGFVMPVTAAPRCAFVLKARQARNPEFSIEFFNSERARFLNSSTEQSLTFDARPETVWAWVEARSEKRGFDFAKLAEADKQEMLNRVAKKWTANLSQKSFWSGERSSSGARLQRVMAQVLEEMHAPGWFELPPSLRLRARNAVAARVQSEILSQEMVEAYQAGGEKVAPLRFDHLGRRVFAAGGVSWAVSLALSVTSPMWMKGAIGGAFLPPFLPRSKFEYLRALDTDLVRKIRSTDKGYQAFETEVQRQLGRDAKAGWAVDMAARIVVIICVVAFLELFYENYPEIVAFIKYAYRAEMQPHEAPQQLGAQAVREELLGGWRKWFELNNQREPSSAEVNAAVERFSAIPDTRLLGRSG